VGYVFYAKRQLGKHFGMPGILTYPTSPYKAYRKISQTSGGSISIAMWFKFGVTNTYVIETRSASLFNIY